MKIPELSNTAMFFISVSSMDAIQAGPIKRAAKRTGPKIVRIINDFFLTRVKYSLDIIRFILFMMVNIYGNYFLFSFTAFINTSFMLGIISLKEMISTAGIINESNSFSLV